MKKRYSFIEGVLSLCSLPKIRKYVLPVLISLVTALLIFSKIKESRLTFFGIEENTESRKELIITAALQEIEKNIFEAGYLAKAAVETGKSAGKDFFSKLDNIDLQLENVSSLNRDTEIPQNCLLYLNLLKQKAEVQRKIGYEIQAGNIQKALSHLNSVELRKMENSLANTAEGMKQDMTALPAVTIPGMEKKNKQLYFWSWMVYVSGAIIFCLILIYLYIKTKLSTESEKKVKVSSTVKENFLANMSHEIRTPLNAILGFTNILRNTNLDEEQKEYMDIIQTSGDSLLSIVNDILDLSKIEAGMLRIEETPFRVHDIVTTVEAMLKPKAEEKNLRLIVNIDDEVPEIVSGDAVRLTQVLVNLVSNAIKFTDDGGVYLRVTPVKQKTGIVTLEILVRDTGIGIPEDKQKTIFDRFEQAEASTTRRYGGTGLGLSIVKNLIEIQNGTIELFSQPGMGTSFTIKLPYKISNEIVSKEGVQKEAINPSYMNTDAKILIAEDNVMNQRLITHLMKKWNFNFDLVFNGVQALESLKKQSYSLVLMDIQMPEMDGYTATAFIRSELRTSVPVIAMTAHAMAGEKDKCLKAGMNDYVSKPINEEALFGVIQKYLVIKDSEKTVQQTEMAEGETVIKGAKIIDLNVIDKYSGGDTEFRKQLIREFINTVPEAINSLEKAIDQNNYSRIKAIAHDMKTAVHIMGLTLLIGDLLHRIEACAYSNSEISSISAMFSDVKQVCLQAVQEAGRLVA